MDKTEEKGELKRRPTSRKAASKKKKDIQIGHEIWEEKRQCIGRKREEVYWEGVAHCGRHRTFINTKGKNFRRKRIKKRRHRKSRERGERRKANPRRHSQGLSRIKSRDDL